MIIEAQSQDRRRPLSISVSFCFGIVYSADRGRVAFADSARGRERRRGQPGPVPHARQRQPDADDPVAPRGPDHPSVLRLSSNYPPYYIHTALFLNLPSIKLSSYKQSIFII